MRKTMALTRVLLKNGSGQLLGSGKSYRRFLGPLLLLLLVPTFGVTIGNMTSSLYEALASIGQQGALLGLALAVASAVVLAFGVFYVISVFYFAQDIEVLLPLPLRPGQIVTAKFITVLLYEYVTLLLLLGPLLLVYGMKDGGGILYYVYAVLVFLILPVIPLVLASLAAMAIMSFSNLARNKDRFRLWSGIFAIAASLGFNMVIQRTVNSRTGPEQLQQILLGGDNALLNVITRAFPTAQWAAHALLDAGKLTGLAWLLLLVGVSALIYLVFVALSQRFYFKGVVGIGEATARRVRLSDSQLAKGTARQSSLSALVAKELRILVRTPAYFLNCVLLVVLWPLLLYVPFMAQPGARGLGAMLTSFFDPSGASALVAGIVVALLLAISGGNVTAATAISREGSGFFVLKYVPVSYRTVLAAKVLVGWLLTLAGAVILLAGGHFLLKLPVAFTAMMLVCAVAATLFTCLTGIMIDLWSPKLNWDNEQKAVKQNMNGLFNMLLQLVVAGLFILIAAKSGLGLWAGSALLLGLLVLGNVLMILLLRAKGPKWMEQIEG